LIVQTGFKPSAQGRIGPGVYFTLDFNEAKEIALYRFTGEQPVVIKSIAEVDYRKFSRKDSIEELLKKQKECFKFWH
jgi:hypothetical protein